MRRWLRVLICLLLVCCILVNLSPLRAEAVSATAVALSVGIPVAVAVGLQAVGVRQGSSSSAFNQVVNDAVDALSPEWAVNGLTSILALTTDGITKTLANSNFLQALLDFLHGSGTLTESSYPFIGEFNVSFNGESYSLVANNPCIVLCFKAVVRDAPYSWLWYFSRDMGNFSYNGNSVQAGYSYVSGLYSRSIVSASSDVSVSGAPIVDAGSFDSVSEFESFCKGYNASSIGSITTSEDLTLESVGHDIDTDYETYVETGIVGIDFGVQFEDDPNTNRNEEDDGNDLWLPVGIPGQLSGGSYIDQTQQDAQSGNTPQDVLDELLQNSGSGDGSGDGTGSDSGSGNGFGNTWKPPSDHNVFALADLSKFFPFCIPFDLYDFFTLLNAEPVAPVLSWEIKDLAGQTYSLDVDLSQWDSVALLFRRLQLFLFITGLAAASRKFIKW